MLAPLALSAVSLLPAGANAQTSGPLLGTDIPIAVPGVRNATVTDRPRPELAPQGAALGGFRIYPELRIGPGYTSNSLGASIAPREDLFVAVEPRFRLASQWSRHALTVDAAYSSKRYAKVSAKNESAYRVAADGVVDIHGESNAVLGFGYERSYEEQYTESFPANGGASIAVTHPFAVVRGTLALNRLRFIASGNFDRFDYSDTRTTGGAPLDQDYRDRKVYRLAARTEYLFAADSAAFVQASFRRTLYDQRTAALTDRTSRELRLVGGLVTDVTPVVRIAAGVGYAIRRYDQPGLRSLKDVVADVRADWNVTPLTTFSLTGRRGLEEAIIPGAAGYVATNVGTRVDHELLRNLLLNLTVEHERDSFKGVARRDRFDRVGFGATYTMWRNVQLSPLVDHARRRSTGVFAGPSFKETRFVLRASLRL